jgi:hypothetical protein
VEVRSGAGSFHVTFERVAIDDGQIVIFGTVDDWDSRTCVSAGEAVDVMRLVLRPRVLAMLTRFLISSGRAKLRPARQQLPESEQSGQSARTAGGLPTNDS